MFIQIAIMAPNRNELWRSRDPLVVHKAGQTKTPMSVGRRTGLPESSAHSGVSRHPCTPQSQTVNFLSAWVRTRQMRDTAVDY
jgi:hypothetical protein